MCCNAICFCWRFSDMCGFSLEIILFFFNHPHVLSRVFYHATHADKTWPCRIWKWKLQTHVAAPIYCWWLIKYYAQIYRHNINRCQCAMLFGIIKAKQNQKPNAQSKKQLARTHTRTHGANRLKENGVEKTRVFIFLVCLTEFDSDDWFSGKCHIFLFVACLSFCLKFEVRLPLP